MVRTGLAGLVSVASFLGFSSQTQNAVANGETRSLTIRHMHTKEEATITFKSDGRYDSAALEKLNWLLRDWRRDEPTKMDPRLFDIVWEVYRETGSSEPVHIVSAYRSPETNSMLRRRSRGVAKNSQHMMGKAMDFYLPDVAPEKIRSVGMRLQRGGVGYYPTAYTPFVHLDAGSVRSWPRMGHDQLARLFPDGRTVHLPADGHPLAGYEEAKADILARGGSVMGSTSYAEADEGAATGPRRSLWASLFGTDDEDTEYLRETKGSRGRSAKNGDKNGPDQSIKTAMAYAPSANSEDGGTRGFFGMAAPSEPARTERRSRPSPRIVPLPEAEAPARPMPAEAEASTPAVLTAKAAPVQAPLVRPLELAVQKPEAVPVVPPVRVAALAGPSEPDLVWRAGASASVDSAAPKEEAKTLAEKSPVLLAALAHAPLPPMRDDRPVTAESVSVPLPPARPVALAMLAPDTSDAPAALFLSHPAPAARPGSYRAASTLPANPLFDATTTGSLPHSGSVIATAKAKPAPVAANAPVTGPALLKMGFSASLPGDLSPDRFMGPAVKPLPVLR